ncbi:MAG: carboxypeptidase-like regulatory domain-containing protein [Rhodospirillales bacterium]
MPTILPAPILSALVIVLYLAVSVITPAFAAASNSEDGDTQQAAITIVERPDEDLLLLELRLNDLVLVDTMPAFLAGSSIVLPLRDLTDILEFPIAVDSAGGSANGWYLSPNRLFSLNIARGEVILDGVVSRFDPRLVEVHEDDIYVDIRLLARWFPLDLAFDLSNLLIDVTSREPLPIEQKIMRDDYRQRVLLDRTADQADYEWIATPYRAVSVPVADVNAETTVDRDANGDTAMTTRHNVTATGDLLWANAELFVGGDNREKVDDARLRLDRKDPHGNAFAGIPGLDGLDVTEASAGDIFSPQVSMISRTELGRGVQISNMSLEAPSEFDRITLTGELPLGWEAEVYRNEVLLDFQVARSDGQYVFEDVPLVYGVNVLRIVLYGPQGQVKEEIRQFTVGPGQTRAGELDMRFTANQHDQPLLLNDEDASENLEERGRLFYEAQYGVSRELTVGGNFVQLPTDSGTQRYATASANFTFGEVFGRYDAVRQLDEGWAQRLSLQTSQLGLNWLAEHSIYNDFFSEQIAENDDGLASASVLRLDGAVPAEFTGILPRMPFSLRLAHDRRESGDTDTSVENRLSAALGPAAVTNTLNYQLDKSSDNTTSTLSGTTLIGGRIGPFKARGTVGYDVVPTKEFQSVGLSGDWTVTPEWRGSAGINRDLGEDSETTYSLGVNAQLEKAAVGFNVDYSDTSQFTSTMTVSFGVGYDEERSEVFVGSNSIARGGALSAFVFLDADADGEFGDGDEPIEGARFTINRGRHTPLTDAEGKVFITNLPTYRDVTVELDTASLVDPFWVSDRPGYRLVARPGSVSSMAFPVVTTGEIDGTVFRTWTDGTGEAAGVIVQLVDGNGEVVREEQTAYDGFFLFDFVRPGRYTLRVAPEQLMLLGLVTDTSYEIEIRGDGTVVSGQDFVLSTPAVAEANDPLEGWGATVIPGDTAQL